MEKKKCCKPVCPQLKNTLLPDMTIPPGGFVFVSGVGFISCCGGCTRKITSLTLENGSFKTTIAVNVISATLLKFQLPFNIPTGRVVVTLPSIGCCCTPSSVIINVAKTTVVITGDPGSVVCGTALVVPDGLLVASLIKCSETCLTPSCGTPVGPPIQTVSVETNGSFTFDVVPSGCYQIEINCTVLGNTVSTLPCKCYSDNTSLTAGTFSIEDCSVCTPQVVISGAPGSVTCESGSLDGRFSAVLIACSGSCPKPICGTPSFVARSTVVESDGSFVFDSITAGCYQIDIICDGTGPSISSRPCQCYFADTVLPMGAFPIMDCDTVCSQTITFIGDPGSVKCMNGSITRTGQFFAHLFTCLGTCSTSNCDIPFLLIKITTVLADGSFDFKSPATPGCYRIEIHCSQSGALLASLPCQCYSVNTNFPAGTFTIEDCTTCP